MAAGDSGSQPLVMIRRSPTLSLVEAIEEARQSGQDVLSLSTPTFPETELSASVLAAGSTRLSPAEGQPALRKAVRESLFGRWSLPEHQVLISAGAKSAIFSALRVLLRPQSAVLVVAPAWPSYEDLVQLAGHRSCHFATAANEQFRIVEDRLVAAVEATGASAIIVSNPSNPTGRIYQQSELDALLRTAGRFDATLMLDESFSSIVFDPAAWRASITQASPRLILFNSFSKNYHLQGLRVAAAMVHESRFAAVVACHQTILSAAPSVSQSIALATLAASRGDDIATSYLASREIARDIIERAGWALAPGLGSFYFFPRVADPDRTFERMRQVGLYPLAGSAFGEDYADHVRICFGKPEAEMLEIRRRLGSAGLLAGR